MARSTSEFRDDLICRAFNDLEFVGEEQSAAIKSHVIIWTQAEHVLGSVRAVMRVSQRPDMGALGVRTSCSHDANCADLAPMVV